ncbi:WD repeat protein [Tritrichomonas foetus]|uniref:WD repeat protein n=1 Tax=Tritrichomonas foetus TaxID=1144522 RepID=A0A1J4KTI8_9EUKA|nr:WD repeat protein [Tritrichomonas foetus]|eukprot:OHT14609.1 WD repeat protein [Tritrichomonas foetus]
MSYDQILLAACYDLKVHVIDLNSGTAYDEFEISNSQANRVVVSGTRFYIAAYSYLLAFDANGKSKKPLQAIAAHDSNVTDICITPGTLFTCGEDKLIKAWDRRVAQAQQTITTEDALNSMCLMSNGYSVVVGGESGDVSIWDTRNSSSPFKMVSRKSPVRSISISPDSQKFVVAHMDGTAIQYSLDNSSNTFAEINKIVSNNEILLRVATSPDGKLFAATGGECLSKVYSTDDCAIKHTFDASSSAAPPREWIWDAAFTKDSRYLCTGCSDGICKVWDCEEGTLALTAPQLDKCVSAIALIS